MSTLAFARPGAAAALFALASLPLCPMSSVAAQAQSGGGQPTASQSPATTRTTTDDAPSGNETSITRGRLRTGVSYDCKRAMPPQCGTGCRHETTSNTCVKAGN